KRTIVEASPRDRFWGIGMCSSNRLAEVAAKWRGRNWIGIAIQQAREEIKRREGLHATEFEQAMLEEQLKGRDELAKG
ncbi:MAG: NADAR domain-containing protein, partial [Planctomycetota bacterium]